MGSGLVSVGFCFPNFLVFGGSSASWLLMVSLQAPVNLSLMCDRSCFGVGLGISGHRHFSGYCSGVIVEGLGWVLTGGHLKSCFFSVSEKRRGRVSVWGDFCAKHIVAVCGNLAFVMLPQ